MYEKKLTLDLEEKVKEAFRAFIKSFMPNQPLGTSTQQAATKLFVLLELDDEQQGE